MNIKYEKIIGFLAGVVVLGVLIWGVISESQIKKADTVPVTPVVEVPVTPQVKSLSAYLNAPMLTEAETKDWKTFSTAGFLIKYPKDFTVNPNYKNETSGPDRIFMGVSFIAPNPLQPGTNLGGVVVSFEEDPNPAQCEAKSFIDPAMAKFAKQENVVINGTTYTIVTTGDAAAGNYYEEYVIAFPGETCRSARLLIRSGNIGNYDPGTIKEFNKTSLLSIFETMVASYGAK
jgi:hypothetical protein